MTPPAELAEGEVEITCRDWEGRTDTKVISDDFCLITVGNHYVASEQHYPGKGTTVVTIKRAQPDPDPGFSVLDPKQDRA